MPDAPDLATLPMNLGIDMTRKYITLETERAGYALTPEDTQLLIHHLTYLLGCLDEGQNTP